MTLKQSSYKTGIAGSNIIRSYISSSNIRVVLRGRRACPILIFHQLSITKSELNSPISCPDHSRTAESNPALHYSWIAPTNFIFTFLFCGKLYVLCFSWPALCKVINIWGMEGVASLYEIIVLFVRIVLGCEKRVWFE